MDIMLERMLSLIPKKENGKYVHGAKKEFCEAIGAPTNIVSEWEAGKTKSYRNYLYAVSAKYNVSVEWLKGETDEKGIKKQPAANSDELTETQKTAIDMIKSMSDSDLEMYLEILKTIKKKKAD